MSEPPSDAAMVLTQLFSDFLKAPFGDGLLQTLADYPGYVRPTRRCRVRFWMPAIFVTTGARRSDSIRCRMHASAAG